jgi:hypothetical protein
MMEAFTAALCPAQEVSCVSASYAFSQAKQTFGSDDCQGIVVFAFQ